MLVIRDIDHVVLRVSDLESMIRFYCEVLGAGIARRRPDLALVHLRAGASLIDFVDVAGPLGKPGGAAPGNEGRNMDHLCLRIEPFDQAAVIAHLAAHGVKLGEIGRRYGAEGMAMSIYLTDPEGNVVELRGPPDEEPGPKLGS
jgi:glyoxylase I family protein